VKVKLWSLDLLQITKSNKLIQQRCVFLKLFLLRKFKCKKIMFCNFVFRNLFLVHYRKKTFLVLGN